MDNSKIFQELRSLCTENELDNEILLKMQNNCLKVPKNEVLALNKKTFGDFVKTELTKITGDMKNIMEIYRRVKKIKERLQFVLKCCLKRVFYMQKWTDEIDFKFCTSFDLFVQKNEEKVVHEIYNQFLEAKRCKKELKRLKTFARSFLLKYDIDFKTDCTIIAENTNGMLLREKIVFIKRYFDQNDRFYEKYIKTYVEEFEFTAVFFEDLETNKVVLEELKRLKCFEHVKKQVVEYIKVKRSFLWGKIDDYLAFTMLFLDLDFFLQNGKEYFENLQSEPIIKNVLKNSAAIDNLIQFVNMYLSNRINTEVEEFLNYFFVKYNNLIIQKVNLIHKEFITKCKFLNIGKNKIEGDILTCNSFFKCKSRNEKEIEFPRNIKESIRVCKEILEIADFDVEMPDQEISEEQKAVCLKILAEKKMKKQKLFSVEIRRENVLNREKSSSSEILFYLNLFAYKQISSYIQLSPDNEFFMDELRKKFVKRLFSGNFDYKKEISFLSCLSENFKYKMAKMLTELEERSINNKFLTNLVKNEVEEEDKKYVKLLEETELIQRVKNLYGIHEGGFENFSLSGSDLELGNSRYDALRIKNTVSLKDAYKNCSVFLMKKCVWPQFETVELNEVQTALIDQLLDIKTQLCTNLSNDGIKLTFNDLISTITVKIEEFEMKLNLLQFALIREIFNKKTVDVKIGGNKIVSKQIDCLVQEGIIKKEENGFSMNQLKAGDFSFKGSYLVGDFIESSLNSDLHELNRNLTDSAKIMKILKKEKQVEKSHFDSIPKIGDLLKDLEGKEFIKITGETIEYIP
ncbi:hypothetical protein NUSPORA_00395 [Nucleospora cyclopteri]